MICSCCGKPIDGIPTDWEQGLPEKIFRLSPAERAKRSAVSPGGDFAVLDKGHRSELIFVRGMLYIPILETDQRIGLGLWAAMSHGDMLELEEIVHPDPRSWIGTLSATDVPTYPDMDGLPVRVFADPDPKIRPYFVAPSSSPIRQHQDAGISIAAWHRFAKLWSTS